MNLDARMTVPIFEANEDFPRIMHWAESYGRVVIHKDNKPKYLLIDLEQESLIYDLTEEEKLEIATKRIMKQYKPAFEKLAEY
jgi:antitoxin Phd